MHKKRAPFNVVLAGSLSAFLLNGILIYH